MKSQKQCKYNVRIEIQYETWDMANIETKRIYILIVRGVAK